MSTVATLSAIDCLQNVLGRLRGVVGDGGEYKSPCPAHDDRKPSLTISTGDDGRVLLNCHKGCTTEAIVGAMNMQMKDLFPQSENRNKGDGFNTARAAKQWLEDKNGTPSAMWNYWNADGKHVGSVFRFNSPDGSKEFKPVSLINGGWHIKQMPKLRPMYRLREFLAADPNRIVFFVEGEKCADALAALGFVVVACCGGAKSPQFTDWKPLAGHSLVLLPDHDTPGMDCVATVARAVLALDNPAAVKLVEIPGLAEGEDVADWIERGGTAEQLTAMVTAAAEWTPPPAPSTEEKKQSKADKAVKRVSQVVANCPWLLNSVEIMGENEKGESEPHNEPLSMPQILSMLDRVGKGWPRKVGGRLFVEKSETTVSWIHSPSALFGWIASAASHNADWHKYTGCVTKEELFSEVVRTATTYDSIELTPHWPPVPGYYYSCGTPEPGDGTTLNRLLERFSPETDADADLIRAMFATAIWGGDPGNRPAFFITSNTGRGVGKTKLAEMVGYVVGGFMDFSSGEDSAVIKQRLLSPEGREKRLCILDNVKSRRFSWAELEALITTPVISGKAMFIGEGSRPNRLMWIITLNGAALSTDIAQRAVVIKLREPKRSDNWEDDTKRLIFENRTAIIADLIAFFEQEQHALPSHTRWATWERDILSRLPEPAEVQKVIAERRSESDVECEEGSNIEDYFEQQLANLQYDVDTSTIHIPNRLLTTWFNEATNEANKTTSVTRSLTQYHQEKQIRRLKPNPCRSFGRGFLWVGKSADPADEVMYDIREKIDWYSRLGKEKKFRTVG